MTFGPAPFPILPTAPRSYPQTRGFTDCLREKRKLQGFVFAPGTSRLRKADLEMAGRTGSLHAEQKENLARRSARQALLVILAGRVRCEALVTRRGRGDTCRASRSFWERNVEISIKSRGERGSGPNTPHGSLVRLGAIRPDRGLCVFLKL